MRKLLVALLAAATLTGAARADTFTVVVGEATLPSAQVRNGPGDITPPPQISVPPLFPQTLSYGQLLQLWQRAGDAYGIPWEVLASINQIESNFGRNMGPSWAGAVGWMQFLPSTWEDWGLDANGDGIADPWNATDAVYAAARYLAAAGAHEDLPRAIYAYNHSDEYVDAVLSGAARYAADPLLGSLLLELPGGGPSIEELEARLAEARARADELADRLAELQGELERNGWELDAAEQRAGDPRLSEAEFTAAREALSALEGGQAGLLGELNAASLDLGQAQAEVLRLEQDLVIATAPTRYGDLEGLLPAPPTEAAGAAIGYALSKLGTPYQWGGNHGFTLEQMLEGEPDPAYGFDCSSLLAWAFAKGANLYIGDWTGSQWEYGLVAPGATRGNGPAQGGATPPGGYLPGDLVFFNDTDHVALYIGNDLFVHAPHSGDVVKISRLSEYGPVWGWVRYSQVSGIEVEEGSAAEEPAETRVFTIVEEPASSDGGILTFTRD
jgi:cell wall-associated NlpC family hydrolase